MRSKILVALAVGLQAAANGGVAGVAEASVRALAKVVPVMPPRLRRRVEALRMATVPATRRSTSAVASASCSALVPSSEMGAVSGMGREASVGLSAIAREN